MGARHHSELHAWQLSSMLRDEVLELAAMPAVSRHLKYCDQITDAASSAPRNIAEGFGRYTHREFARFLSIAIGSLAELQTLLDEAHARQLLDDPRYARLHALSVRAWKATAALKNSLGRRPPPKPRRPTTRKIER
jgi:four helix bundle protein